SSNRCPGVRHSTFESLRLGLSSQSIASGFLRFWDSLNFKKDKSLWESRFFSSMKSGMTYQQLKLVISQQLIPYFPYLKKSTVFLIYFFIYATLASVMDSSLPRIALTMVSGKKKILLLKKDRDNPVNSPFQAEQQMEANFSGSSSTSRQNQKIDVGGSSSNRRPSVRHSTFESLRLGLSSQRIASGFLRLWDSLNFKKDREFVGITVLFLDEKNAPFQAEQQMKANFFGSSSTSRQNQKIDVGGSLIKGILQRSETA
ncbi:hypothetical protein HID58_062051, partial [Brassica napus]